MNIPTYTKGCCLKCKVCCIYLFLLNQHWTNRESHQTFSWTWPQQNQSNSDTSLPDSSSTGQSSWAKVFLMIQFIWPRITFIISKSRFSPQNVTCGDNMCCRHFTSPSKGSPRSTAASIGNSMPCPTIPILSRSVKNKFLLPWVLVRNRMYKNLWCN